MMPTFAEIPVLSLAAARVESTKPAFLAQLRDALLDVGFLYLADTGLPEELVAQVVTETRRFFEELPWEEKLAIEMKNQKSFLGYSRVR
jgi:isopenicillin N synthase-like dioxygenase